MQTSLSRILVLAAGLILAGSTAAQSNIDELMEQTGIEAGDVALRDMPGWHEPKKVVMPNVGLSQEELDKLLPGVEVVVVRSRSEVLANVEGADALIGSCYRDLIDAAADRVANGSAVLTNMQKMSAPVIGEHVVALSLSLARRIPQFAKEMSTGEWHRNTDMSDGMMSVTGKTMLVVGLGGIGTEAARRAAALGMRVTGTRRSSREGPDFVQYVGLSDERFKLAAEADFIVNALPLTPETTGLFDAEFFNAAKKGAFFINVGRGPTVVTDDLVAALESGQLAGAGMDVTDPEPLPADHPLWQMDNVIITPHVSGRDSNRARHLILLKENLRRFAAGDALLNVVDPQLGY
jgi:phosphoglycerate dehydrogenase-like enzyme